MYVCVYVSVLYCYHGYLLQGTNLTSHIGYRIQWQNYTCLTNESIDLSGKENISHVITGLSPNVLYTVQVTPICNQSIEIAARANTSVLTLGQGTGQHSAGHTDTSVFLCSCHCSSKECVC